MRFSVYQESKKGSRRVNQDRMGYCFTRDAMMMVLCDGLGGHSLGEVAASRRCRPWRASSSATRAR